MSAKKEMTYQERLLLRSTMVAAYENTIKGRQTTHLRYDGTRGAFKAWQQQLSMFFRSKLGDEAAYILALQGQEQGWT